MSISWKSFLIVVLLIVFYYTMFGAEIMYRHAPGMLALIEHTINFPPNTCRIVNIKELKGTGTVVWGVIRNNNTGAMIEHVWGIDSNGNNIDLTCSDIVCSKMGVYAAITVKDYDIIGVTMLSSECSLAVSHLNSLIKYIDFALATNKAYNTLNFDILPALKDGVLRRCR
jgi:hypothetical protein